MPRLTACQRSVTLPAAAGASRVPRDGSGPATWGKGGGAANKERRLPVLVGDSGKAEAVLGPPAEGQADLMCLLLLL